MLGTCSSFLAALQQDHPAATKNHWGQLKSESQGEPRPLARFRLCYLAPSLTHRALPALRKWPWSHKNKLMPHHAKEGLASLCPCTEGTYKHQPGRAAPGGVHVLTACEPPACAPLWWLADERVLPQTPGNWVHGHRRACSSGCAERLTGMQKYLITLNSSSRRYFSAVFWF